MKNSLLIISILFIAGCMAPDYPDKPAMVTDETEGNIEVLQVIDNDEILAYYKNRDNLGHFKIKNMKSDIVDGAIYNVKGVKQVGVYRYNSALGSVKTIPDYTVDNDMKIDEKNAKLLKEYDEDFPDEQRKKHLPLLPFSCLSIYSPIFTPFALISSPICMFDSKCYFTFDCMTEKEKAIPYKDRQ
ncbi:MAG: hypothetical protein LBJ73_03770 [Rickettsiales bacterium]|jgi:hypothetical protein|nr:hypothetical protein [Rickettsiales bacterium]